jgi:predicted CXXCH cytochrome family protein
MKRTSGSRAAPLRTPGRERRFAARSLVAAPVLTGAWLFLAAFPAAADGGPHVMNTNSGVSTLTADSCAGCHRAHTAQGSMLLTIDEEALCLTCHGSAGVGASTDVEVGVQFKVARATGSAGQDETSGTAVLGALRGGGFVTARIDSGNAARVLRSGSADRQFAKVRALSTGQAVTSAHLRVGTASVTPKGIAWGNGTTSGTATPGPAVTLRCASCHNPHGNGQYRILNPIPTVASGTIAAGTGVSVTDGPAVPAGDMRNYTIIQTNGTSRLLLASEVVTGGYSATAGDYWHVRVPWTSTAGGADTDAPNGVPVDTLASAAFNTQITSWCASCHTRYPSATADSPSFDAVFRYRHETSGRLACTTCHVAHGSNAQMPGAPSLGTTYSANFPYPDTSTSASSRLLKVDNRGTCQLCHDPTETVSTLSPGTYTGPTPTPGVP